MASYLDRLIARAGGEPRPLAPLVAGARSLDVNPFEQVIADAPVIPASPHVTEIVRESATVIERIIDADPVRPVMHATPSREPPPPIAREVIELAPPPQPITRTTPLPQTAIEVQPRVALEPEAPPPAITVPAPIPPALVHMTDLHVPSAEPDVVERWLAPSSAPAREIVRVTEFSPPAPSPPPIAPTLRPITPRASESPPPPPIASAPIADDRPALTIGRLVVEVRNQPPAQPATTTIVRTVAPTAPVAQAPNPLHRSFGLGQS
jgi:hypothetical protein